MDTNLKWDGKRKCQTVTECSLRYTGTHTSNHLQQEAVGGLPREPGYGC